MLQHWMSIQLCNKQAFLKRLCVDQNTVHAKSVQLVRVVQ